MEEKKYEEFKVGQRVFFPLRNGINAYGNVVEIHPEEKSLLIRGDHGEMFERFMKVVTRL